jgi:uncharacterized glyoxalase superfamily protein PhnB
MSGERLAGLAKSVTRVNPMIYVPDVTAALAWYTELGFTEEARFEECGLVNFGIVSLGGAEILINMHGSRGEHDASLWFYTDRVDEMYAELKGRVEVVEEINDTFYRARQFGVRDLNGYMLWFLQEL